MPNQTWPRIELPNLSSRPNRNFGKNAPVYKTAALRPAPAPAVETFRTLTAPTRVVPAVTGRRLGWYLRLHLLCLILYAFFGKGFAYVGARFFYVSEALLVLGLAALIASRRLSVLFRTPVGLVMLPFLLWQCLCALPYIGDYGTNVARGRSRLGLRGLRLDRGRSYRICTRPARTLTGTLSPFCALVFVIWSIGRACQCVFRRKNANMARHRRCGDCSEIRRVRWRIWRESRRPFIAGLNPASWVVGAGRSRRFNRLH